MSRLCVNKASRSGRDGDHIMFLRLRRGSGPVCRHTTQGDLTSTTEKQATERLRSGGRAVAYGIRRKRGGTGIDKRDGIGG
jgi:hypothetical protein